MSESLQIRHGDLGLEGNKLAVVSGPQKIQQDLRNAILTPFGYYEVWSNYGSTLNEMVGQDNWEETSLDVKAEISRIVGEYQRQQIARNESDAAHYGRFTIGPDETVLEVTGYKMIRSQDHLLVDVSLAVGNGTIRIAFPIVNV
jgi:phage baseplate assembly protein W